MATTIFGPMDILNQAGRLWNRVRGPIAKSIQTFSGMAFTAAQRQASIADRTSWADALAQPVGIVDERPVQFQFEIHAGSARTVVGLADFAAEANIQFHGHVCPPFV